MESLRHGNDKLNNKKGFHKSLIIPSESYWSIRIIDKSSEGNVNIDYTKETVNEAQKNINI